MPSKPFFTMEMGIRLRQLRARKGLSQSELAVRMGLRGKGSWSLVSRLERGRIASPSLMLVTHYLNACGALFSELYDVLTPADLRAAGTGRMRASHAHGPAIPERA